MSNRLNLLFFLGRPFSPLYGLAMKIREHFYAKGFFRSYSLPVPVISVGNLVLGGTGKTPTVRYLTEFLKIQGYHPAIISRGYGGMAKGKVNIVADAGGVFLDPQQAGDEPYMLARMLPGTPVLTGKRRIDPARRAIENMQADILILDDGFQHLALRRDIDVVLFDGSSLAGNSRIFPGGVLREPISALHRGTAFLITGITAKNRQKAEQFGELLRARYGKKPVFYSGLGSCGLKNPVQETGLGALNQQKAFFGICGIANPERFEESLKHLEIEQTGFLALSDHARYSQSLIDDICARARISGATHLVTTEKDYVKLAQLKVSLPLEVIEIRAQIDKAFDEFILESLNAKS